MKMESAPPLRFSEALLWRGSAANGWLALGPGLNVYEFDRWPESVAELSDDVVDSLCSLGVVVAQSNHGHRTRPCAAIPGHEVAVAGTIAAHASDRGRQAAEALRAALAELGMSFPVRQVDDATKSTGGLVVWMTQTECLSPLDEIGSLLRAQNSVLWFGETTAGLQVGPLFTSIADVGAYSEATLQWGQATELANLGFETAWPLSLIDRVLADATAVAAAVVRVLVRPRTCVLLPGNEEVALWTEVRRQPQPLQVLLDRQRWPKGMFSGMRVEPLPGAGFLATCVPPTRGIAALEGCNGKGLTSAHAQLTAMGEAVERFAANEAGRLLSPAPWRASDLRIEEFHPLLDETDGLTPNFPSVTAGFVAVDELTGATAHVPECLVPFPYIPRANGPRVGSHTAGLAAFPERDGAVLRGALELLERDNFYPNFLHLRAGTNITHDPALGSVSAMLVKIRSALDVEIWLLEYPSDAALPIVHAFILDRGHGHLSRGTGSGTTVSAAAQCAVLEALMGRVQHEHLRHNPGIEGQVEYRQWADARVVDLVVAYLHAQRLRTSAARQAEDEVELAARVFEACRARCGALLVADLPCPVRGWSAVRVLAPGLTCHAQASGTAGGAALVGAAFEFGVPT